MAAPALIGTATSLLGSVVSASGALAAGKAQANANKFLSQQALFNAQIAKKNATYARMEGEGEAMAYGIGASARMGQIKIAQAASGLDVNTGSGVLVRQSQQYVTDIDLTRIRSNAAKRAYDFDVEAVRFENQAKLYQMAAENASKAGAINAAASLIGGIGSVASQWYGSSQKFG